MGLIILTKLAGWAKAVPFWVWIVAVALAWGGWQRHLATSRAAEFAKAQAVAVKAREEAAAKSIAETTRRLNAQVEVAKNADQQAISARASAASANAAADRLRERFVALQAGGRTLGPATAASGTSTPSPDLVLSDVFGRCLTRVQQLAEYADTTRIAGQACEQAYTSLGH